ncbi:MAG: hypothetical protein V4622_08720 [Bacteroidota bacterium]
MKIFFTFLLLTSHFTFFSQDQISLTSEEKAYLYHIVKKSPILDTNIGRYFEYKGKIIRFANKDINYDSIEINIINNPEKLFIRTSEIAKSPKGIIAEATNKIALWELNKVLLAKRTGEKELQNYIVQYMRFEKILLPLLPPNAFKETSEGKIPHPKLEQILNPSLSFNDKKDLLSTFHFLDIEDQLLVYRAFNQAVNEYVKVRSNEFYLLLGGDAQQFDNVLIAAGDGSSSAGLLEEREKDEKGRWNKGLPKAVGLFPYLAEIKRGTKTEKETLKPEKFAVLDFFTAGKNKNTIVHCDVWGYNADKQTTVVIEKNGLSYHLFGSGETRFLAPDSTFSSGLTFQSIINQLEFDRIAKIDEMIHGKKGFDYWIEYNEKKKQETELKIEKEEKAYSDMGYSPITTSSKASHAVKKHRRKSKKFTNYDPTTNSNKKTRKKSQQKIVDLYNLFEAYKRKIAELKIQKQEAIDKRAVYQAKLDHYKQLMGYKWATYTEKDGLYTFQDSSTFDLYTQEFVFSPTKEKDPFEVKLLAIPNDCLSELADEVMMHVSVIDAKPTFDARLQIHLEDVFDSDQWKLKDKLLSDNDSVAVRQFFEALQEDKKFEVIARGQGMGVWNGSRTVKQTDPEVLEMSLYPSSKMDTAFVRLRKSEVLISLNREILLEINSFTDPVSSNIKVTNEEISKKMLTYKLTKNQVLSAYRSATILFQLKEELNVLAGKQFNREESKKIIDKLNKEIAKTKITVGATSIDLEEFK